MLVIILATLSLYCNLTPTVKYLNYDCFWYNGSFMCICLKTEMDLAYKSQIFFFFFFACFKLNELDTLDFHILDVTQVN